jgi:hypothetical protein
MLPVYRTEDEALSPPKFILAHSDVDDFLHELRGFHEAFRECFTRREPRAHFFRYLVGQFSSLFMQRLTLRLFLSSEDAQSTRAPSVAWSGNNCYCSARSHATPPYWCRDDWAWRGGAARARSAQ